MKIVRDAAKICLSLLMLAASPAHAAGHASFPSFVPQEVRSALGAWLGDHPGYELMTEADCHCTADLKQIRVLGSGAKAQPDYQPYFVRGDFDGDHRLDTAIAVTRDHNRFQVLILAGKAGNRPYLSPPIDVGDLLFIDANGRLSVGPLGTDFYDEFIPARDGSYLLKVPGQ